MRDILIFALAVVPPLFLAGFFLTHFRHRFGLGLGAKAVIGGMISAPMALGFSLMLRRSGIEADGLMGAAVQAWLGAAIPEEIAKFLIVWFYIRRHPACDSAGDLFCGSVLVGIGFALLENILYVTGAEHAWVQTGMTRAMLAVPGHTIDGMVMGVFLAWWWRKAIPPVMAICLALFLPIMAHGLYDFPLMVLDRALPPQLQTQLTWLFNLVLAISALAAIWAARMELVEVFRHTEPDVDLHPGHPGLLRLWRWIGRAIVAAAGLLGVFGGVLAWFGDIEGTSLIAIALLPAAFGVIMSMRLPAPRHSATHYWPTPH